MRIVFILFNKSIALSGFMLLNVLVAQMYGAQALGLLANFVVLATACSIVIRYGSDNDLLKNVGTAWRDNNIVAAADIWRETSLFFIIRLGLLAAVAALLIGFLGSASVAPSFVAAVLLGGALMAFCYAGSALLRAIERYLEAPLLEPGTAFLVAAILLGLYGLFDPVAINHSHTLYIILPLLCLFILAGFGFKYSMSKAQLSFKLRLKSPATLCTQFVLLTRRNTEFFVAALVVFSQQWITLGGMNIFGDLSDVGFLQAALTIGSVVGIVVTVINSTVASDMAHAAKMGDIVLLRGLYRRSRLKIIAAAVPLIVVLWLLSPWLLSLFGTGFERYQTVLYVILGAFFVNVMTGPVGLVLSMSGREREYRMALLIGASIGLLSVPYFIQSFGVLGAGWVFFIIMAIQNSISYVFVRRFLDVKL